MEQKLELISEDFIFGSCPPRFFGRVTSRNLLASNVVVTGKIKGSTDSSILKHRLVVRSPHPWVSFPIKPDEVETSDIYRDFYFRLEKIWIYPSLTPSLLDQDLDFSLGAVFTKPYLGLEMISLTVESTPEVVTGKEGEVVTTVDLEANGDVNHVQLTFSPIRHGPMQVRSEIAGVSEEAVTYGMPILTIPRKEFPQRLNPSKKGARFSHSIKTAIRSSQLMPMPFCEVPVLSIGISAISVLDPDEFPFPVRIEGPDGRPLPKPTTSYVSQTFRLQSMVRYFPEPTPL